MMLRLLLLCCALVAAENLECEVDLVSGDQVLDDPTTRLLVTSESLPLTTKFPADATELLQRYQIRIQTAQFRLSAFNANNQSVGVAKSYADLAEAGCIALGVGESPDCVGLLGCDGFVLGVVKTLQQFPETARYFAFNFTFFIIDPETTVVRGFWLWKTHEKVGASVLLVSEPQITLWEPSDALRAQAFPTTAAAASSDDTETWKTLALVFGSVLGTFVCLSLVYIGFLARRQTLEERHHHPPATPEETKPLMPPPKPNYDVKEQLQSRLTKRAATMPTYALTGMEPARV